MSFMASLVAQKLPKPRNLALLRRRQATILVAGILIVATGIMFACNILALLRVSWPVLALMLCATGGLQLFIAYQFRERVLFAAWGIVAGLYILFGLFALTGPPRQLAVLVLFFFAGVIGNGIMRAYCGYVARTIRGCHWLIAGGVMTIGIGAFLAFRWPHGDLAFSGLLLAVDLALYGISLVGFSLHLGDFTSEPGREPPRA